LCYDEFFPWQTIMAPKSKRLTVCKSNKVIEAGYRLTLNEQRLVLACIAKVNSVKQLLASERFELSAKEFAKFFGVTEDRAYHALKDVAEQLFERYVIIDNPDPDDPSLKFTKTRWISSINYYPDRGKITLYFAYQMLPYLGQLKGEFTKYDLEYIGRMTSIYGIRLYELLMQWHSTGTREIELDWLKRQFQIEDKYASIKDFKKYVIDPAVADINTHSNLHVAWTQRKTGRRVTHLIFTFGEKNAAPKPPGKSKKAANETRIGGVPKSEIERQARPGESYVDAAARISAARSTQ
jgi:plasmid replication initiation protein